MWIKNRLTVLECRSSFFVTHHPSFCTFTLLVGEQEGYAVSDVATAGFFKTFALPNEVKPMMDFGWFSSHEHILYVSH